jgi:colanic acid biosynthesis glycosyl transferase WcaI
LKILIVTQYFWPENFRINDLACELKTRGHAVTVITGIPNYPSGKFFPGYGRRQRRREMWNGIEIIRCALLPRGAGGGLRLALNYLSFALSASLIAPWRCQGKFDVIFCYAPSPITVALPAIVFRWIKRAPLFLWVQDLWPESLTAAGAVQSRMVLALAGRLVRAIYRRCDVILAQSRGFTPRISSMGVPPDKIRYFPSWAEAVFSSQPVAGTGARLPMLPSGFRIIFAGNVGAAQDFASIIDAAEKLKNEQAIHWIVLGEGRMLEWVKNRIGERNLQGCIHLLGSFPLESMPHFFRRADVMLVALKREPIFSLTIPGKVQSYLACGRPVVAMLDGEGARVVTEAGAGLAGPAEDPQALADNVLALFRMTDAERAQMGESGRRYYSLHFERDRLISQLEGWMSESSTLRPHGR